MDTRRDLDEIFRAFLSGPWLLLFALAIIAGIVLSAVVRLPHATVELSVDATTVQVTAAAPFETQINMGLGPDSSVYADHVSLNLNDLGCSVRQTPNAFHIQGELTLSQLVLASGTRLKIERSDNGGIAFDFSGGGALRLTAGRGLRVFDGNDHSLDCSKTSEGLLIEFRPLDAQAAGGRESTIRLLVAGRPPDGALFQIRNLKINDLRFGREETGSELLPLFTSTIAEGKIRVLETDREASLREGDPVRFDMLKGEILELTLDRNRIHLRAVGYARGIRVGPEPFSVELCPTYLEYVVRNERLKALWIAAAGVIGALWTMRQWAKGVD